MRKLIPWMLVALAPLAYAGPFDSLPELGAYESRMCDVVAWADASTKGGSLTDDSGRIFSYSADQVKVLRMRALDELQKTIPDARRRLIAAKTKGAALTAAEKHILAAAREREEHVDTVMRNKAEEEAKLNRRAFLIAEQARIQAAAYQARSAEASRRLELGEIEAAARRGAESAADARARIAAVGNNIDAQLEQNQRYMDQQRMKSIEDRQRELIDIENRRRASEGRPTLRP